jgi:hypothetical protein
MEARLGWLHRWRQRDDRHLFKSQHPLPEIDPIEELARIVGEAQERDAEMIADSKRSISIGPARQAPFARRALHPPAQGGDPKRNRITANLDWQ